MIKLVTIDIDKTLINDQMRIPESNIETIRKAVSKGCHIVLLSGRISSSVRKYMQVLGIQGIVPSDGGCVIEKWDGTIVKEYNIPCSDSVSIYDTIRKYNEYPLGYYRADWYYDKENSYWSEQEVLATDLLGKEVNLRDFISKTPVNKLLFPCLDAEIINKVKEEVLSNHSDTVDCFPSSLEYLEIMPKGVTKGTAVNDLISYFGIKKDEVLAIGDYYNDIDMFKAAGHSAAVNNAPDDIKKIVEYISPLDNNHGAVSQIINYYL